MNLLHVTGLSKSFRGNSVPAVRNAAFDLYEGKILALVGESGSGKTTLLRLLAGLETPDTGEIVLDGNLLSTPKSVVQPERRGIGMVFQHHALFPHLTVGKNIAFGIHKWDPANQRDTISSLLELIGLPGFEKRYPHELSGGERQRVALARALAPQPRLLLLDEPFSSLDARLRHSVRDETRAILKKRGATAIFVTHDTADALTIADRIVVLKHGDIQQTGAPPEIYHAHANSYVASFFGTCNFIPFHLLRPTSGSRLSCHIGPPDLAAGNGLWIRPEKLALHPPHTRPPDALTGTVRSVAFCGPHLEVTLRCESAPGNFFEVTVHHHAASIVTPGESWAIAPTL
jgi:iron(III) transport system ATP-binding protein